MQGNFNYKEGVISKESGILPRTAEFIFIETNRLMKLNQSFKISFSAIEIYNENIFDLLDKPTVQNKKNSIQNQRQPLNVYISGNDIQIKKLIWVDINSMEDIIKFIKDASDSRRSDSTLYNSVSSRSHAVFQIKLENKNVCNQEIRTSVINIIDLAGSERSSISSWEGKTKEEIDLAKRIQNEANFINKSLTTLGRIISLIADKKCNKVAIPYRESKLTMVLQVK
jgi:hypothetical protein